MVGLPWLPDGLLTDVIGFVVNISLVVLLRNQAREQSEDVIAGGYGVITRHALIGVGVGVVVLAVLVPLMTAIDYALQA